MPLKLPFFQLYFSRGEFERAEELVWTETLKLGNCGVQLSLMMWSFAAIFDFHTSVRLSVLSENVSPVREHENGAVQRAGPLPSLKHIHFSRPSSLSLVGG